MKLESTLTLILSTLANRRRTLRAQDSSLLRIHCFAEGERKLHGSMTAGAAVMIHLVP